MIFDKLLESRASLENPSTSLSDPANWLFGAFGAQPSSSNIIITERNAIQITAFWSAVNTISDTLAELPVKLVRTKPTGETITVKHHHTITLLTLSPNPMMTAVVLRSTIQAHTLVWGNGYYWIRRNAAREPLELWPLMPNHTRPVIANGELTFHTKLDIGQTILPAADVIHIPALSRNGISGMSVIQEQRETLGGALATQKFGAKFFANGAHPGGLISYPGTVRDTDKVRDAIERATTGDASQGLMVLSDDASYTPFAVPPDDAQFLQTREFGVDEIARMFRLPSHFLNKMGQATFNNLEAMSTHFAQYTMLPWIIRCEQEYSRKLLTESEIRRGLRYKFNLGALIRGDIKTRFEVYAKAITFGVLTPNEARGLEERNPMEGGDVLLRPLNLGIVGDEPDDPPPPPSPAPGDDGSDEDTSDEDNSDEDRSFLILTAAAQRLANKEAIKMRRLWHLESEKQDEEVARFYDGHVALMIENLALNPVHARQYCRNRIATLFAAGDVEERLLQMVTGDVASLVNQITEDRK